MEETIAAISTALIPSGISVIRVSGNKSIEIVSKIYKEKNLNKVKSHTINYGHIIDFENNIIDEVLISVMKAPKTFTREDVVEINCHGGIAITNKILELILMCGARIAEPGEFTKRAFLNGRIDLQEAEGIMDLIEAETESSRKVAINKLKGSVSSLIRKLRQEILEILANIEVNIDYPEYDDALEITNKILKPRILTIKEKINKILIESETGRIVSEGIKTAIIGRPNVGKSSLLNELLEENKAIVTDIEGTTRDFVEGKIILDGILLKLIDTAGIRKADNLVEEIGINKSKELINEADLILFMIDASNELTEDEKELLEIIREKKSIIILNKIDLGIKKQDLLENYKHIISMSVKEKLGIDRLKEQIKELFNLEEINNGNFTYINNTRNITYLKQSVLKIDEILNAVKNETPVDFIEIDLKEVWDILGKIIGESYEEELIDQLFKQFCLGK